jgi:AcrR family transcriptional regulator
VANRALIILEAASGATRTELADRFGMSVRTVTHWCERYEVEGTDGLRDRPRSGRPRMTARTANGEAGVSGAGVRSGGQPVNGALDRLFKASIEMIATRGFADTRVSDIAEAAGVSRASIHYYFKSKNDILIQSLWWASERQLAHLAEVASEPDDLVARLARFIERLIPYEGSVQAEEYLLEIDLWSRARLDPSLRQAWARYSAQYVADAAALISDGVEAGVFPQGIEVEDLAERMIALTDALSIQCVVGAERMPPERVRALVLRFLAEQLEVPFERLDELARLPAISRMSN